MQRLAPARKIAMGHGMQWWSTTSCKARVHGMLPHRFMLTFNAQSAPQHAVLTPSGNVEDSGQTGAHIAMLAPVQDTLLSPNQLVLTCHAAGAG